MRKLTLLLFISFLLCTQAFAIEQAKYSLSNLFLPNFVDSRCFSTFTKSEYNVLSLDERYVNKIGSDLSPTSCKGEICWSWKVLKSNEDWFNQQIFSSNLPVRIADSRRISESISQTVKKHETLRKNASNLTSAAQEFVNANFHVAKGQSIQREKSMTQSESKELSVETSVTAHFHAFISKGLQGPLANFSVYPFCYSASADLILKAHERDKLDTLIHAFTIYRTIKPEDIAFSNSNNMLNIAKLLYTLLNAKKERAKDYAWAQSVLFAELIDTWAEFSDLKVWLQQEIQKIHAKYTLALSKTTKELYMGGEKELAITKFRKDKELAKQQQIQHSTVEDIYLQSAVESITSKVPDDELHFDKQALENLLSQNDVIVTKKFYTPPLREKLKTMQLAIPLAIAATAIGIVLVYARRKKEKNN